MSRIKYASKNIKYGYLGNLLSLLLKFISRTIFIYTIGVTYLGVNGLYVNILSVLSFAELGIGTAMNYSLYKPVAENDKEKIKALMHLYKYAYRWIALIVTVVGLALIPFLDTIIKESGIISSNELIIYYLIFLFNTTSTYFVVYKYSLVSAEQKNYLQTNIQTITMVITTIVQIIILISLKNFLLYLISAALIELIQKIFVNRYLNKRYPFLLDDVTRKLTKEEKEPIIKNIKALVLHKIGDISVYQTDNILISSFINITTVGLVSNYTLIISAVTSFLNIIFNSLISGFGNLIATENTDKQYELFKVYRFVGFWCYGFASIALITLINPFIELWIGSQMLIGTTVIYLIISDYYLKGHRIVVNNFKVAAGIFDEDKYIGLIQAIVNLVISIILVKKIGLPGIFIGTVIQGLISNMSRPFIVYRKIFGRSGIEYYVDSLFYLCVLIVPLLVLEFMKPIILMNLGISNFVFMIFLVALIPNVFFVLFLRKRKEFKYLLDLIKIRVKGRR
ncbi:lipopolysaccharide biosynthesis protein [Alkalibacter saccharofermentans]|uniref:Membrane protein involved in the export of O-antigen and teichoic acid n=1 Tax=Alkalibacter saccharofermentans DSM 14828 TaxID=1120975 RepID=A0A1M4WQ35_9FIRM|nr:polysaccharide biosynthesis protein [Alkalibacter saccharofermentans]SHE83324.1 Membrane protein involved in the export of O-antigen and teichoic acid [Alkalibacter saccharofermentans DSM 14828]